jgi:hypothetical protein
MLDRVVHVVTIVLLSVEVWWSLFTIYLNSILPTGNIYIFCIVDVIMCELVVLFWSIFICVSVILFLRV